MKMYKAFIFDLDGTLTDTLESLTFSVNATLEELGLEKITQEQCRAFVGNGARVLIERSLEAAGDETSSMLEKAMEIYGRIFKEHCTYKVAPYDGVTEMLKALKRQGMKLAVLSNKPHLQTKDVVQTFFGTELFDEVQGQEDGKARKPDPKALYEVLERLQVDQKECVYVGDSEVDMMTGKAAGVLTVGVTWGFRTKDVLQEHGADHTVDSAEQLVTFI